MSAIANHRLVHTVRLDGGKLILGPPQNSDASISLNRAQRIVAEALTGSPGSYNPALVAVGRVTLNESTTGLPLYTNRLAWVALIGPQMAFSCLGSFSGESYATRPLSFDVVLLDAGSGGAVLQYRTRGVGLCGGTIEGPAVQRATEILSLPWTAIGQTPVTQQQIQRLVPPNAPNAASAAATLKSAVNWVIRYTIPACGTQFDSGVYMINPTKPILYIDASVPISPPSHCSPARTVNTTWGPEDVGISQAGHAPVGLASGAAL